MREIVRPGLILFLVALVAAVCLGAVHEITLEPIAQQEAIRKAESMKKLLPSADRFEEIDVDASAGVKSLTVGYAGGQETGCVIGVVTKGFGGDIEMLIAVDAQGGVGGVEFVNMSETPGLGTKAKEFAFTGQYQGKSGPFTVIKGIASKENDVEAITSATITSRAVTLGVNTALTYYQDNIAKGAQ